MRMYALHIMHTMSECQAAYIKIKDRKGEQKIKQLETRTGESPECRQAVNR